MRCDYKNGATYLLAEGLSGIDLSKSAGFANKDIKIAFVNS